MLIKFTVIVTGQSREGLRSEASAWQGDLEKGAGGGRTEGWGVGTVGVEQPDISSQESESAPVDSRQRETGSLQKERFRLTAG